MGDSNRNTEPASFSRTLFERILLTIHLLPDCASGSFPPCRRWLQMFHWPLPLYSVCTTSNPRNHSPGTVLLVSWPSVVQARYWPANTSASQIALPSPAWSPTKPQPPRIQMFPSPHRTSLRWSLVLRSWLFLWEGQAASTWHYRSRTRTWRSCSRPPCRQSLHQRWWQGTRGRRGGGGHSGAQRVRGDRRKHWAQRARSSRSGWHWGHARGGLCQRRSHGWRWFCAWSWWCRDRSWSFSSARTDAWFGRRSCWPRCRAPPWWRCSGTLRQTEIENGGCWHFHACGMVVKKRLHRRATTCLKCHSIFNRGEGRDDELMSAELWYRLLVLGHSIPLFTNGTPGRKTRRRSGFARGCLLPLVFLVA